MVWELGRTDCRRFLSEKPCQRLKECGDCLDYDPMGTRILIIKLAAGGDVLRTACLLSGLKREHPVSHITWLTESAHIPLLRNHPLIDRVLPACAESYLSLTAQRFDYLLNLDKEPHALALAEGVDAQYRCGFGMDRFGSIRPLSAASDYLVRLGISDHLKFYENTKSYPLLIYEACGLAYANDRYRLYLDERQKAAVDNNRRAARANTVFIGFNTGSGPVFATKKWPIDRWIELAVILDREFAVSLALLGGPDERERNRQIREQCPLPLLDTGTENSLEDFIAIVGALDILVTADTLAMHIALALERRVIALIGPTSATEIDLFDCGEKVTTDFDCAPCYLKTCDRHPTCMEALSARSVADAVGRQIRLLSR